MISITCDSCETQLNTGVGRFVIDKDGARFFCKDCEEKLVLGALKAAKPVRPVKRTSKPNGAETLVATN